MTQPSRVSDKAGMMSEKLLAASISPAPKPSIMLLARREMRLGSTTGKLPSAVAAAATRPPLERIRDDRVEPREDRRSFPQDDLRTHANDDRADASPQHPCRTGAARLPGNRIVRGRRGVYEPMVSAARSTISVKPS